jgi:carbon monoxide dehydrogenase subunit G
MTTYESEIKTISANNEVVFAKLSDLKNLEILKEKIPADAGISNFECDTDWIRFNINPVGKIGLVVLERETPKTIKLGAENSPIDFNLWIQLVPLDDSATKMKITLKADIPPMIKMMAGSKLEDFVNQLASGLSKIQF